MTSRDGHLERQAALYAVLSATNEAVLHARSAPELYQKVCDASLVGGNFRSAAIGIPDPESAWLQIEASAGRSDLLNSARISVHESAPEGKGPAGNAFRSQQTCISNDFLADESTSYWHESARRHGIGSSAAVPLRHGGRAIGILLLYAPERGVFDEETVRLLERMASNVSFALDNFLRDAEHLRAVEASRHRDEKFRHILESIEDAYYEVDLEGKHLVLNPALSRMIGYSEDAILGQTNRSFQTPEMIAETYAAFSEVYRTGLPILSCDWQYRHRSGSVVQVEGSIHLVKDETGSPTGFRGIFRNVTERRKIEKALRVSEERYRTIIESMEEGYYETDLQGYDLHSNPAFYRMTGYTPEEMIGKQARQRQTPEMAEATTRIFNEVYRTGQPKQGQYWEFLHKDGSVVQVEGSVHLVRNDAGEPVGFRGIMRDITQRRREERLLALEHRVALGLAEAPSVRKAVQMVLRSVLESEQWESAGYWVPGEEAGTLRLELGWANTNMKSAAHEFYRDLVGSLTASADGYLRTVWDAGKPHWIPDARKNRKFMDDPSSYIMTAPNQRAAFYVPVLSAGRVVSMMSFSNSAIRQPDERLVQTMGVISSQFGQFLQRKQAEEVLRESEERFRALTELSSDWYWEQDGDLRFTRMESRHESRDEIHQMLIGRRFREAGFQILSDGGWDSYDRLAAGREPFRDLVMRMVLQNGRPYYVSVSGEPVIGADGALLGYRGVCREITDQKIAEERIHFLATHDVLTGLPNRMLFSHLLNGAIAGARRYGRDFAVLFIDLDRFKFINDTLGHDAGDALLKEVSGRLHAVLRESDVIARLGGDEFVVLVQELNAPEQAAVIARKLLAAASQPVLLSGQECRVTASIGIALFPDGADDEQALMKNADIAMYYAKEEGKNNYQFYSPEIRTQSLERLTLEAKLRHALERGEFEVHYQPKLDLKSGAITGAEALLRWNSAELGAVSPMQFIPLAEETGLIVPIGKWVLRQACIRNMEWQRRGLPTISVAVNLSVRQFADPDLLRDIAATLEETGMPAGLLELEITEGMVIASPERAARLLSAIRAMGVRLALDDFGTGYSSLGQLKHFPIDTIKIDRSFIRDIETDEGDRAIASAIIAMGRALSLTVVAEGVETARQRAFLHSQGCDEMQGFYFSPPVDAAVLAELLAASACPRAASAG